MPTAAQVKRQNIKRRATEHRLECIESMKKHNRQQMTHIQQQHERQMIRIHTEAMTRQLEIDPGTTDFQSPAATPFSPVAQEAQPSQTGPSEEAKEAVAAPEADGGTAEAQPDEATQQQPDRDREAKTEATEAAELNQEQTDKPGKGKGKGKRKGKKGKGKKGKGRDGGSEANA